MGSYTPKLNLYKPAVGEQGWGSLVNQNFDILDNSEVKLPITTSVVGSGSCVANPTSVSSGESSVITSTANANYHFTDLKVNGTSVGATSPYTISNITSSQTVVATFSLNPKITASAGANGSITPSGETYVTYNGNQTYTITPNSGYMVDTLTVDGSTVTAATSYTFNNVIADHTIAVTFKVSTIYSFTIPYQSSPKGITYGDSATSMTQAERQALLRSHAHHAVVKTDGSGINYWLYKNNLNYKAKDSTCEESSGVESDLTGTDGDVMLVYDPIWWTVSGSVGSAMEIKISWEEQSGWVSPHLYGTDIQNYLCVGVFEGYNNGGTLRSINTSKTPTVSQTENTFYTQAINGRSAKANVQLPMTRMLMDIFYLFEFGNRNCQAKVGNGISSAYFPSSCNNSWDATNPWNNGDTSVKNKGVTCCGIHNPWGNINEFLGEIIVKYGTPYFSIQGGYDHVSIKSNPPSTWRTGTTGFSSMSGGGYIVDVTRDLYFPFFPESISNGSSSTYYCDVMTCFTNGPYFVDVSGDYTRDEYCGLFYVVANGYVTDTNEYLGARLQLFI